MPLLSFSPSLSHAISICSDFFFFWPFNVGGPSQCTTFLAPGIENLEKDACGPPSGELPCELLGYIEV